MSRDSAINEKVTEQTAIFAAVPTEKLPQILCFLTDSGIADEDIRTHALPMSREEAGEMTTTLRGTPDRSWPVAYEETLHDTMPITLVREVATGATTEVITKENLQTVSRALWTTPHVGASVAGAIFGRAFSQFYTGDRQEFTDKYIFTYRPKEATRRALRADMARQLLTAYTDGGDNLEATLRLSPKGRILLARTCELIEVEPGRTV